MEDLRDTAYAYHEAAKQAKENENEEAIVAFFNEMDANRDNRISFDEFKRYMKTVGQEKFGSDKDFFDKLKQKGNGDYLVYSDVVTLLYIINSGRPFCEKCRWFVEGSFFTCVRCFEKEKDYYYNFCPSCYSVGKNHTHCHEEFMDPISLLRLKAKRELKKPVIGRVLSVKNEVQPSDSKTSPLPSSSLQKEESIPNSSKSNDSNNAHHHCVTKKPDRALELMQFAVSCTTIAAAASQLCIIM